MQELTCPLVVIDVHEKCRREHLYELSVADVEAWEAAHGRVPAGAMVCMRTGWDARFGE